MRLWNTSLFKLVENYLYNYNTSANLNYFWAFGSLAGLALTIQLVTGIVLAMHYIPDALIAFSSIEHIVRDVQYGWLLRYVHANGASMFFFVVYLHIWRSIWYYSYEQPRTAAWVIGLIIYLLMMATAFLGYILPWGQMSFWGATVITNFVSAIPFVGTDIVIWLWGGYSVSAPTLNRFYSLHYLLPMILVCCVIIHLFMLHQAESNNPLGISVLSVQKIAFHPFYVYKDILGVIIFFCFFTYFVCFNPNMLGHSDNYIQANPLVTPLHIVPEWYFLPYYAMLRSIPNKELGIIVMLLSILIFFFIPFIRKDSFNIRINSNKNKRLFEQLNSYISLKKQLSCYYLAITWLGLLWLGGKEPIEPYVTLAQFLTVTYFVLIIAIRFIALDKTR